jgi:hypothetical protein
MHPRKDLSIIMNRYRPFLALAVFVALIAAAPAARFGGSVDSGAPNLQNTLALVIAGGGPKDFSTVTLFGVLAGDKATAEEGALTKKYGADKFGQFVKTFDFVINDSLAIVTKAGVKLPATPSPDPKDGKALSLALYGDGTDATTKGFNVEYMLDHLVTHPVHVQVMKDIDAKYGEQADADYHVILTQVMHDLASVYAPPSNKM